MKNHSLEVDIAGLRSITHACTGCSGEAGRCCSRYEVTIGDDELRNIIQYMPQVSRLCTHLESGESFDNVFDEISRGLYALDTDDEGTCLFACESGDRLLCSLHTVALDRGIPLREIKPRSCILWPLALFEDKKSILTFDEEALAFTCTRRRAGERDRSLCPSIAGIVEHAFGEVFLKELEQALRRGLDWATIEVRPE